MSPINPKAKIGQDPIRFCQVFDLMDKVIDIKTCIHRQGDQNRQQVSLFFFGYQR